MMARCSLVSSSLSLQAQTPCPIFLFLSGLLIHGNTWYVAVSYLLPRRVERVACLSALFRRVFLATTRNGEAASNKSCMYRFWTAGS